MTGQSETLRVHVPPATGHMKDVIVDHALGRWAYDTTGGKCLDLTSGVAVTNTGYCHPRVVAAAQSRAGKLIHGFQNLYWHQPALRAADQHQ